jgi:7-cyano-7-deazaguanine reductase
MIKIKEDGMDKQDLGTVKGLGSGNTNYRTVYCPEVLEWFKNIFPDTDHMVTLNCPEFTSLCPKTKQPDFASIYIQYIPAEKLVESKSLKLYLFGYRQHGSFHESCVNMICNDLVKLLEPKFLEVQGFFLPRGGISIDPYAIYACDDYKEFSKQRMIMRNAYIREVRNR